tara:strand:- start:110 stop:361 length:252 start_codon:yes stop_codon:yes gene_type:complete
MTTVPRNNQGFDLEEQLKRMSFASFPEQLLARRKIHDWINTEAQTRVRRDISRIKNQRYINQLLSVGVPYWAQQAVWDRKGRV